MFTISCTTCQSRLKVRDEAAVGQIHTCPRCGSMVMITPPRATSPGAAHRSDGEPASELPVGAAAAGTSSLLEFTFDDAVEILNQASPPAAPVPAAPATAAPAPAAPAPAAKSAAPVVPHTPVRAAAPAKGVNLWSDTVDEVEKPREVASAALNPAPVAAQTIVAPVPTAVRDFADAIDDATAQTDSERLEPEVLAEGQDAPLLPEARWASPAATAWRQWLLFGGATLAGVALAVGVFGYAVISATRSRPVADATGAQVSAPDADADDGDNFPAEPATPVDAAVAGPGPAEAAPANENAATAQDASSGTATSDNRASAPPVAAASNTDEAQPPPPATPDAASPFHEAATEPSPSEVAANADLLDAYGEFFGGPTAPDPPGEVAAASASPPEAPPSGIGSDEPPAAESPLPRPAPREVDVAARLADPIAEIEIEAMPLVDFLQFVSDLSTIPITIEPEALAWRGLSPVAVVTVRQTDTTVEGILDAGLSPLGLGFVGDDGQGVVTTLSTRDAALRKIKHPVEDLTGGDAKELAELGELIVRLVAPETWKAAGGEGVLESLEGGLSIEQTEAVHFRVIAFCETLRIARRMPPRTRFDAAHFQPGAAQKAARAKLATPVSLNYRQPTELTTILAAFGKLAGLTILVDWRAAAEAGWQPGAKGSVVGDGAILAETLTRLLTPMDLAYRVLDGSTLEVTTPEKLRSQTQTVFYAVDDLLKAKFTETTLLDRIRAELGQVRFDEGRGALHLDATSQHLIAALPQPQQDELASLLETLRKP